MKTLVVAGIGLAVMAVANPAAGHVVEAATSIPHGQYLAGRIPTAEPRAGWFQADFAGDRVPAQPLRRLRHDRQRLGMDDRLVFAKARSRCGEGLLHSEKTRAVDPSRKPRPLSAASEDPRKVLKGARIFARPTTAAAIAGRAPCTAGRHFNLSHRTQMRRSHVDADIAPRMRAVNSHLPRIILFTIVVLILAESHRMHRTGGISAHLGGPGRSPGRHAGAAVLSAAGDVHHLRCARWTQGCPHRTIALLLDHRVEPGQASRTAAGGSDVDRKDHPARAPAGWNLPVHRIKRFYPVEALIVAILLAFVPYFLIRGPVARNCATLDPACRF